MRKYWFVINRLIKRVKKLGFGNENDAYLVGGDSTTFK